jgi:hypothetical protein
MRRESARCLAIYTDEERMRNYGGTAKFRTFASGDDAAIVRMAGPPEVSGKFLECETAYHEPDGSVWIKIGWDRFAELRFQRSNYGSPHTTGTAWPERPVEFPLTFGLETTRLDADQPFTSSSLFSRFSSAICSLLPLAVTPI